MSPSRITTSPLREPHCDITDEEFQELYDKVLKDIDLTQSTESADLIA
jgi:hypothetical protein